MKKLLLLALCVFGVLLSANAQNMTDVVTLKNGSVIKGIIVEQRPNEAIKIETRDGNVFVYKMDEIEKLSKEAEQTHPSKAYFDTTEFNKPSGYMGIVEVSGGLGIGDWAADRMSLTIINGYRLLPQFAFGLGIGYEMFLYEAASGAADYSPESALPVFLHLRSDFIAKKVSPFVAFNVGYNVSLSGGYFGGLLLEPSMGVSYNAGKGRMTIGLSLRMNRVQYFSSSMGAGKAMGYALALRIGYSF